MKLTFTDAKDPLSGVVVVPVAAEGKLMAQGVALDAALNNALSRAINNQPRFSGKKDEILSVNGFDHKDITHVVLAGVGEAETLKVLEAQKLGATIGGHLQSAGYKAATIDVRDLMLQDAAAHLAFGLKSRLYRFDKYRTTLKPEQKNLLEIVYMITDKKVDETWLTHEALLQGIFLARDLVTEPPNALYPASFVSKVQDAVKDLPLNVKILDKAQMQELGMGALLAVSLGTKREPFTLIIEYNGLGNDHFPLSLIGKGVTFDTGGLCLKAGMPPGGWPMSDMKTDMAGGAAVVGAMMALAARKAKANVVGLIGLVENGIDAEAYLPADVVTSMSGQTIEVLNTDAEGRMVLADVLWYAQETYKPKTVVDIATLTGAILMALSDQYAGVFSDNDILADQLVAAGKISGNRVWHMPLDATLDKHLDSQIADMANVGIGGAGASTGAMFVKRFIQKDVAWAHIDMAGMAWSKTGTSIAPIGATGYGVQLFDQFVRENFEQ